MLVLLPALAAGAVVALYLLLLGWGMLMHVRRISDVTRRATKRLNPYPRRVAGTRLGMPLSAYPLGDVFLLAAAYPYVDDAGEAAPDRCRGAARFLVAASRRNANDADRRRLIGTHS
ncbi:hypothetical protein AWC11_13915 [Mycobacterium interjectum]|nr:hypothetical protein AWC11_13915 [Mycobacterium interjectum]